MSVLKSEWLKLVSVRTTWALLGAMIFIEGKTVCRSFTSCSP